MKPLRVDDALQVMASKCRTLAGEVAADAPPEVGLSSQPSSAAMNLGHTGVQAAAAALTARMQNTGGDIGGAWSDYNHNEAASAAKLRVV